MSVWDWVDSYEGRAVTSEQFQLVDLYYQSARYYDVDPDRELAMLSQGRALAEKLSEPWWMVFFDHWRVQSLFSKGDYTAAREIAIKGTVEARQSAAAGCPQRVCLHEDLIKVYIGSDPDGYAALIEEALQYMEQEIAPHYECRFCLRGARTRYALAANRLDEALEAGQGYLNLSESERNDHHVSDAYVYLCAVAYRRKDWERLGAWAEMGEQAARRIDRKPDTVAFLAWQAVAKRKASDEQAAQGLYRQATARKSRIGAMPYPYYYDALSGYHEIGGRLDLALKVRRQQLEALSGKGRVAVECWAHLESCRLLAQMGKSLDAELAAAREVAGKLVNPLPYLEKLEHVAGG